MDKYECELCGGSEFRYEGEVQIAKIIFESYECLKCGERHLMQTERVVKDNGNNIRKISFKQNTKRIHGVSGLLEQKD
jgi:hypothetical protein